MNACNEKSKTIIIRNKYNTNAQIIKKMIKFFAMINTILLASVGIDFCVRISYVKRNILFFNYT